MHQRPTHHEHVEDLMRRPPHVKSARPHGLGHARGEEEGAEPVHASLQEPVRHPGPDPHLGPAVQTQAVDDGREARQRGRDEGPGAQGAVADSLEAGVGDEQEGEQDEEGDHAPVEALQGRVGIEADVDAGDEGCED